MNAAVCNSPLDDFSPYHNDSIHLDDKYQKIMDWSIWFHEYYIRSELDIPADEKLFIEEPYPDADDDINKDPLWRADAIINVLLNCKKLNSSVFFTTKGFEKVFLDKNTRIAFYGQMSEMQISDSDKYINNILVNAQNSINNAVKESPYENNTIHLAAINIEQDLDIIKSQVEEIYLYAKGKDLEANLVRFARTFGKNITYMDANSSRVAGLWMWDYMKIKELTGESITLIDAVRAFEDKYAHANLGLTKRDYSDFRRLIRHTQRCIDDKSVLPIKGGTPRKK